MKLVLLTTDLVYALHDAVLNTGDLAGRALDQSLDAALARVEGSLAHDMVKDAFARAAACAMATNPPRPVR